MPFLSALVIFLNQDGATSVWPDLKHQGKIEAKFSSPYQTRWAAQGTGQEQSKCLPDSWSETLLQCQQLP